MLYKRLGIFNMFNPHRPDGEYLLNLEIYEEKMVAKILCELARAEGWANMTQVKFLNKPVEKMTNDVAKSIADTGKFECSY